MLLDEITCWEIVTKASPIIISLAALGTSIASYQLSQKLASNYDVKKLHLKNQFEAVSDMMKELNDISLHIRIVSEHTEEQSIGVAVDLSLQGVSLESITTFDFRDRPMSLIEDFFDKFTLFKYSNNIFIPRDIALQLRRLWVLKGMSESFVYFQQYAFITLTNSQEEYPRPTYILRPFPDSETYATVGTFLTQIVQVKLAVSEWLEQFGIQDINTNAG